MRAVIGQQAHPAVAILEGDQVFAQQADAQRWTVRNELMRKQEGQPVLPEKRPRQCARPNAGQQLVVFLAQHDSRLPVLMDESNYTGRRDILFDDPPILALG